MLSRFVKVVSTSLELRYYDANMGVRMPRIKSIRVLSSDKKVGNVAS